MDKALRKKLVDKLKDAKGFDPTYSKENRAWFCGAVLDQLAKTTADADLEKKATDIITNANARVKADRNFTLSLNLDAALSKVERKQVTERVETIYGVIAQNVDFADTTFDAVRQFIVKRRYRGIVRMVHEVNPNSNGFLRYPPECPAWGDMRLNDDARPNWIPAVKGSTVPLRVTDSADPETAAELILDKAYPDACKGNLLDCGNGTACVLMDTLFEAADTDKLFKAIKSRGALHMLVINPTLQIAKAPHFLFENDSEPKKLFSKQLVADEDLQIGDHVYLVNHGLYPNVAPNGAWTGEHALVTQCGNRKAGDAKGFLFSGHGLDTPRTVESLYDDLVKYIQSYLHRTYTIADLFFQFRDKKITIPASDLDIQSLNFPASPPISMIAYRIVKPIKFNYYVPPPTGGKPATLKEGTKDLPLVIFELDGGKDIRIAPPTPNNTIANQMKRPNKMTILSRTDNPPSGGSIFDKTLWKIPFLDTETIKPAFYPLFGGPKGAFKLLDRADMPKKKFGRRNATDVGADATRPTSETTTTYVNFLKSIGAIP